MLDSTDPTQRFSVRVNDYVKFRPSYPAQLIPLLNEQFGFSATAVVADIGSGTGILTRRLLENGNRVFAVEPNDAMRLSAEAQLSTFTTFRSINATAEATTLPNASIDWITAGQAFHWFDAAASAVEWHRILRPGGQVLLIWNQWGSTDTPFMRPYTAIIQRCCPDYAKTSRTRSADQISTFFDGDYAQFMLPNPHRYSWEMLLGRVRSASYAPLPDQPGYAPLLADLRDLFEKYATDGTIPFDYETHLYIGRPKSKLID